MNFKFAALIPALLIVGCGAEKEFVVNSTTASDFSYTMANQPAVSVTVISDDNNFCDLTIFRGNVREGYSVTSEQQSSDELSASCTWQGNYFVQSSKHPTKASLTLQSIDAQSQIATFNVDLKLVNNKTLKDYFELENVQFTVSGSEFANLTTSPEA
ncbi:hypothetical protein [Vibrio parahaemolyticus]|uniref:hypothetical protein n=1 Tax=Vibrio parahaemolyticus TaxID=670 RepID=UPI00226A4E52|nr:hypothetical protein [Vibrio parahaemolyticus]MCX8827946.1 hypothetical protein [Vibrio parahaemolyticus]MCX8928696.1 hypothetical protein [Vibrio parahaemolyticus]